MIDLSFNNCLHIIGGAGFALLAILVVRRQAETWVTFALGILSGTLTNVLWELIVDDFGWITFFGRAGQPDPLDAFRGFFGALIATVIWWNWQRRRKR